MVLQQKKTADTEEAIFSFIKNVKYPKICDKKWRRLFLPFRVLSYAFSLSCWGAAHSSYTSQSGYIPCSKHKKSQNNIVLTDKTKYLGVTIDSTLSWSHHINTITKKADKTIAFLRQNLSSCPSDVKVTC